MRDMSNSARPSRGGDGRAQERATGEVAHLHSYDITTDIHHLSPPQYHSASTEPAGQAALTYAQRPLHRVLDALRIRGRVRRSGENWLARCPVPGHGRGRGDRNPSLSVGEGPDGRVLLRCHSGCPAEAVVEALGLTMSDLFPRLEPRRGLNSKPRRGLTVRELAKAKQLPQDIAARYLRDVPGGVQIVYRGEDGSELPVVRIRRRLTGQARFAWAPGSHPTLFGQDLLPQARRLGWVIVCEGESDVMVLAAASLPGLGIPGAAAEEALAPPHVRGLGTVYVVSEPDAAGQAFPARVARRLRALGWSGRVLALNPAPHKDLADAWVALGGDPERFRTWLLEAMDRTVPVEPVEPVPPVAAFDGARGSAGHPYRVTRDGIARERWTREGPVLDLLANFDARIVAEEVRDDGAERRIVFMVSGRIGEEALPPVAVPAERFATMAWPLEAWGHRAIVYPGQGTKDHLRAAIQLLSGSVPRRVVYEHLGWREDNRRWVYLHAGGAIGATGAVADVSVETDAALRAFMLPEPPSGEALREAVRASLAVLGVAPRRLTIPLLAAVYRAPLGEALAADFSLFYSGPTGAKKTSLTALAQAHYGSEFSDRHLPAGWEATGNALERLAFLAKDAVLVVDDFAPKGATADVQRLHREADRVLRAQANRSGRRRLSADGSLRPVYTPRSLIVASGEDVPVGQSLRARVLVLEVASGEVNLQALTSSQRDAAEGRFAAALSAYVGWLAPRMNELRETLRDRKLALREEARREEWAHDRTPDLLASLALGWEHFLAFAEDAGVLTAKDRERLWGEGWNALAEAAREQASHQADQEPAGRFLALLSAAITSGRAHVADAETGEGPDDAKRWGWQLRTVGEGAREEWQPQGERVGWLAGDELLLEPDAAFAAVQRLARDQGTSLPVTQRTLWKRLAEKGFILTERDRRQTYYLVRRTVAGSRRRVLVLTQASPISQNMANMANMAEALQHKASEAKSVAMSGEEIWPVRHENMATAPGAAMKYGQLAMSGEEHGHKTGPESLAAQGPGHTGHVGHEMEHRGSIGGESEVIQWRR